MTSMHEWTPGAVVSQTDHPGADGTRDHPTWTRSALMVDGTNRSFTPFDLREGATDATTAVGAEILMRGDDAVTVLKPDPPAEAAPADPTEPLPMDTPEPPTAPPDQRRRTTRSRT